MHRLRALARPSRRTPADAGRRTNRPRLRLAATAVLALAVAALSACGSSAVTSNGGGSSTSAAAAPSSAAAAPSSAVASSAPASPAAGGSSGTTETDLSAVPAGAKSAYTNYQLYSKLYPNAYQNFKPPTGKVQYCESTFYLGNTYQQGEVAAFKQMISQLAAQGKAESNFIVQNSNNSVATQVSQLQSEIQSGCDVIFLNNNSTTAFCDQYTNAIQKNVLVISLDPSYCNNAITVSFDVYENSYELAANLYKGMNYQGNLLLVTGIPGVADAATATDAAMAAMKGHPGLKVVGQYTGQWTASVAQTATAQWIASHPGTKVDGIVDEGAMGVAAETALQQAGRPLAKVSLQEGDCQELAFQTANPSLVTYMTDQAPAPGAYASMNVALRILAGQQPALDTILYPIPGPTAATFNQWYTSDMTTSSACFASPKPALPALKGYLAQFFTGGTQVASFPEPS
jgi:ribose transport system substrate-binding protein